MGRVGAIRQGALDRLPVRTALPALEQALDEHGAAVLCAPPGTGKTTLVPLALAERGARVLVAEPRRIAARAAARRMAWLLGEKPGGTVGFTVRGERAVSNRTVVEVVTTGVLVQRLQRDQELAGVDVVILDECHERHLDADTAAAFVLDVRAALRPELKLVAASATTDAAGWARLLGGAPVVEAEGALHPVQEVWAPPARPVRPPHGMRVDPALLAHTASTVRRALRERDGDVLCFLPGVGEIARVAGRLADVDAEVLQVHGRAPAAVQDAVLSGSAARRRVVLATSVAESSLTVPGVRVVVDAGLAREPRMDHARGLSALTTVRVSRAAARQRAGRAGREGPGAVYRCWSQAEDARLTAFPSPEIKVADLTAFALQAACWGDASAAGLALLDAPPSGALAAARSVLAAIGAVDAAGRVTERGIRMSRLGVHPRLARALLDGAPEVGVRRAAEVIALLSEEPPREYGDDLSSAWRAARRGGDAYATRWRTEAARLAAGLSPARPGTAGSAPQDSTEQRPHAAAGTPRDTGVRLPDGAGSGARRGAKLPRSGGGASAPDQPSPERGPGGEASGSGKGRGGGNALPPRTDDAVAGLVTALAFPERVAGARGRGAFLMASGTAAETADGSGLRDAGWLAVAVADRSGAAASARVRLAAVIDEDTARTAAAHLLAEGEEVHWQDGDVVARDVRRLGAVELSARGLRDPDPARVRDALLDGLRREGPGLLRWTREGQALRERLAFLHRAVGGPWPDVGDDALLDRAGDWLEPELSRARRRADLGRLDAAQALTRLLPWATGDAVRLDELAPERIEVPSGSRIRVEYGGEQPVLAVKLQEMFGLAETPLVAGVPVLVHLLSPAGRPAAVTADLGSFWKDGYRAVRAELRGRYPKHPWPEDPSTAAPTRHTKARQARAPGVTR
ncbi:ATP-dependent RNA helicase [Streptomyces sp. MUM 178J]|uniref:ATP-dependent RNA helicase n=1 Tax=Streptomyces sp. MUM 178J TaxID=2791991 RepID=UPI001F0452B2|nr:ATP-dependent helicase C-terminal domain-containing protein [Streptomyces sp. MUM 178J]WRQ78894.1 ATP-dependent helicase C-terminal domain-containing protein [Streptomyces sp. MUM 178J]